MTMLADFKQLLGSTAKLDAEEISDGAFRDCVEMLQQQLFDLGEQFSGADFQGHADLAVLLGERLGACQAPKHLVIPQDGISELLVKAFTAIDEATASSAVAWLSDVKWPNPLPEQDREFLQLLLNEASESSINPFVLDDLVEVAPISADEPNCTSDSFAYQLYTTLDHRQAGNFDLQSYTVALELFASHCFDKQLSGLSDAIAFYLECFSSAMSQGLRSDAEVILATLAAFKELTEQPSEQAVENLLVHLGDARWPTPLEDDDAEYLKPLLKDDVPQLQQLAEVALMPEQSLGSVADDVSEVDSSSVDDDLSLRGYLLDLASSQLDSTTHLDAFLACFAELSEQLREVDLHGLCDLVTLYSEALSQASDSGQFLQDGRELSKALTNYLSAATNEHLLVMVDKISDALINEPLLDDDKEFLTSLLQDDANALSKSIRSLGIEPLSVNTAAPSESQVAVSAAPLSEETKSEADEEGSNSSTDYLVFDLTGVVFAPVKVDQTVLTMLVGSVDALCDAWKSQPLHSLAGLLDTTSATLSQVNRAMKTLSMEGIHLLIEGLIENLNTLIESPDSEGYKSTAAIKDCLFAVVGYLKALDSESANVLLSAYTSIYLPKPLSAPDAQTFEQLLAFARLSGVDDVERQQVHDEDMELAWPDDVDPSLFEMMLNELPELTEELTSELMALLNAGTLDNLRVIQRMAHTIKGLANMVGIKGLATLTHCVEDIFDILVEHKVIPAKGLGDALMEAADCLANMTDFICSQGPKPTQAKAISQAIHDWFYRLQVEGVDIATSAMPVTIAQQEPEENVEETANPVAETSQPAPQQQEADSVFRVSKSTVDRLLRLAGESSTLSAQLDEELVQIRGFTRQSRERHRNMQTLLEGLDQQLSEYYTIDPRLDSEDEDFDPLEMDRYNEMHTLLSMLNEAADDMREVEASLDAHIRKVGELHLAQSGLQKESLDNVLSTRLVSVKSIVPRMQRIMRQACRAAEKQAELVVVGEALRVDSQILDQLADPLMHVIRNAVDHGLEVPDVRLVEGKPEQGSLSVSFTEREGLIYVECRDDGAGIDLERVKQVAIEKQLIDEGAELSSAEARRLILLPGFSTRDNVTQLSGRGIGMDVVYQQVTRMQGNLNITTERGVGTAFTLSLPSSSILVRALLVQVGGHIVTLAGHGVGQSLLSIDGVMRKDEDGQAWFDVGIDSYPAYTIEELLFESEFDYSSKSVHPVLLVKQADGQKVAVLVREIMAHKELVFKETGPYVPNIPGIPGVTILSNGHAAIVVDLPARVMFFGQKGFDLSSVYEAVEEVSLPKLLVVDDSLSARKSLAVLLKDTGYEVQTAIDGVDALNQIRREMPDLILTDFEMPRMTGTELAEMVRSRDETAQIPMIMISSRSAAKHRAEADKSGISAYVTKPWTETMLLEQIESLLVK